MIIAKPVASSINRLLTIDEMMNSEPLNVKSREAPKCSRKLNLDCVQDPARVVRRGKYAGISCREGDKANNDGNEKGIAILTGYCGDVDSIVAVST